MPEPQDKAVAKEDPDTQYNCCRGILVYGGLQRSIGQEPRCLGHKTPLENVEVTEEDVVQPPPEEARFLFVGVGMSVYNREMLSRNCLPLVNGFSQLIVSKEYAPEKETQQSDRTTKRNVARQRQQQDGMVGAVPVDVGRHATPKRHDSREYSDSRVPKQVAPQRRPKFSAEEVEALRIKEREEVKQEARAKIEALVNGGRARVEKQWQVSVELARIAPEKLRQAAGIQVAKAQEMPGMMMNTAKRGLELGGSAVQYISTKLAEQDDKKK